MKLGKRSWIVLAGGAMVLLIILAVAVPRLMTPDASTSALETAAVRRGTLEATVSATGAISPPREAQLAFNGTGSLVKLEVKQGDWVKTGQLLAALDTRELELQLAQSEASLIAAQAKLDQLKNPSPADVAAAQAGVASAEATLAQLKSPTLNDLTVAKSDLDKARAALERAQSDYDRIGGATNPYIGMMPQALALQQASLDYQKVLALYNAKINPNDSQLKQAQATVEQARSQLARLTNPNPNDMKSAQANVDQVRAARDLAKMRLDNMVLRAPFDGIVTHVDFDLGSFVTAGRVVVGIADTSELRVKVNIDETDISKIKVGQEVIITLDAYTDVTINAKVTEVAALATTVQGVVNYVVTITLDPGNVPLKLGMTADANIVVAHKDNVLLVPNRAVRAVGNQRYVTLFKGPGQIEEIEVKLGLANDQDTEVIGGLTEGQQVVTAGLQQNPMTGFGAPGR